MSVVGADTSANDSSPSSRNGEKGSAVVADTPGGEDTLHGEENEQAPKLHAKTYLAVFTVCVIYYAQLVNLVGAGAVRDFLLYTRCIAHVATLRSDSHTCSKPRQLRLRLAGPAKRYGSAPQWSS